MTFSQLAVDKEIKRVLEKFEKPTPIQASCWPICLSGKDVIGIAETGYIYPLIYLFFIGRGSCLFFDVFLIIID